jgi:3-hydroxybutyryl-CoA dehydratase
MRRALLRDVKAGASLLPVIKHISQDKINYFSVISDATDAVHVDAEYCRNSPIKTTLANGFLTYGYICEMMENNFGPDWMLSGEIEVKFIGAVRPNDALVVGGVIEKVAEAEGKTAVSCKVAAVNQDGADCVVGSTKLVLASS